MRHPASHGPVSGRRSVPEERTAIASPDRRSRRSFLATFTVLALVLRLVLAATPMSMPEASGGGTLLPICTAEGLKWVSVDPDAPAPASKPAPSCPFCFAALGFVAALAPSVDTPVAAPVLSGETPSFHRDAPVLRVAARPPPGRGPPDLSNSETPVCSS